MGNCCPIHKQMLSMVCVCVHSRRAHHTLLLLLLNPGPSAEALDGWEGVGGRRGGGCGNTGRRVVAKIKDGTVCVLVL